MRADPGPIASEDLSVYHRGADGLLGGPVGGFEVLLVQKGQQLVTMLVQMIAKRAAALEAGTHGQQAIEAFLQSPSGDGVAMIRDVGLASSIPQRQGVEDELLDSYGESRGLGPQLFDDLHCPRATGETP